jgi:hypothetical protein
MNRSAISLTGTNSIATRRNRAKPKPMNASKKPNRGTDPSSAAVKTNTSHPAHVESARSRRRYPRSSAQSDERNEEPADDRNALCPAATRGRATRLDRISAELTSGDVS